MKSPTRQTPTPRYIQAFDSFLHQIKASRGREVDLYEILDQLVCELRKTSNCKPFFIPDEAIHVYCRSCSFSGLSLEQLVPLFELEISNYRKLIRKGINKKAVKLQLKKLVVFALMLRDDQKDLLQADPGRSPLINDRK